MRILFTAILGLLFVAAFFVFFMLRSVAGYVDSPDRMMESAKSAGLRSELITLSSTYIAKRVASDPSLQEMSVEQLELIIGGVLSEELFDETLITAHGELQDAIVGVEKNAVVDLRSIKSALQGALSEMKIQAMDNCKLLLSPERCKDARESTDMIASFEARANAAIDDIEDEVSLLGGLEGQELERAEELSEAFEGLETLRMIALVFLVLSFTGVILLNTRPLGRLLGTTGGVALLASVVYLLTIAVSDSLASDELSSQMGDLSDENLGGVSTDWVGQMAGDLISGSTMPVSLIGIAGALAVFLSIFLGRR